MSDQTEERSLLEEAAYNYMNRSVGNGTIVRSRSFDWDDDWDEE